MVKKYETKAHKGSWFTALNVAGACGQGKLTIRGHACIELLHQGFWDRLREKERDREWGEREREREKREERERREREEREKRERVREEKARRFLKCY